LRKTLGFVAIGLWLVAGLGAGQGTRIPLESPPFVEFFPNAGFPQGPAVDRRGHVFFAAKDAVLEADERGNLLQNIYTSGSPAGVTPLGNGNFAVTDAGLKAVLELRGDGFFKLLATEFQGDRFKAPGDVVAHRDGRIYFADPVNSSKANASGRVYLIQPGGKVDLFADGLRFPNGLALGLDGKSLFVAETATGKIIRWSLKPDGSAGDRSDFAELDATEGGPDGIRFDAIGNLWVAHFGTGEVVAINKEGRLARRLAVGGQQPTDLVFTGTSLLVTEAEQHRIVRFELGIRGARMPAG